MNRKEQTPICSYCNQPMRPMSLPEAGGWDDAYHWVCFNDSCSYYADGWKWMWESYRVKASYRYRKDPSTGHASPLPVWSETALTDRILNQDQTSP